jgi:hypothetical protein
MKKTILVLVALFALVGCDINNTNDFKDSNITLVADIEASDNNLVVDDSIIGNDNNVTQNILVDENTTKIYNFWEYLIGENNTVKHFDLFTYDNSSKLDGSYINYRMSTDYRTDMNGSDLYKTYDNNGTSIIDDKNIEYKLNIKIGDTVFDGYVFTKVIEVYMPKESYKFKNVMVLEAMIGDDKYTKIYERNVGLVTSLIDKADGRKSKFIKNKVE